MLFDLFICHASEDKDRLVRPLAEALRNERIEVWYDEFSLRPGDGLRRSIDRGLRQSRYGLVVLSPAFFSKGWSQWELDGLVNRQISGDQTVIIPVWLGIERDAVADHSPSLADKIAIDGSLPLPEITKRVLAVLRPQGSTLLVARDLLLEKGLSTPVVTDDWWLDLIESAAYQEDRLWYFPLPSLSSGSSSQERGEGLFRIALQDAWQSAVEDERISQLTAPDAVIQFIEEQPGLLEMCLRDPNRLVWYVPQLTMRGFSGPFEAAFDELLDRSVRESNARRARKERFGSALTTNGLAPACDEDFALRHPTFGDYEAAHVACGFVQGHGAGLGPHTRVHDSIDYAVWFLSTSSDWLPRGHHSYLLEGMKQWAVWPTPGDHHSDYPNRDGWRRFVEALYVARSAQALLNCRTNREHLHARIAYSATYLALPESAEQLMHRFLAEGFIEIWLEQDGRRQREHHATLRSTDTDEDQHQGTAEGANQALQPDRAPRAG